MIYENFWNQCIIFGNQALDPEDRWQSIKYINTNSQSSFAIDVQAQLKTPTIIYVPKTESDDPGFLIVEATNEIVMHNSQVTFIGITDIYSISFVDKIGNIDDYMSRLESNTDNLLPIPEEGLGTVPGSSHTEEELIDLLESKLDKSPVSSYPLFSNGDIAQYYLPDYLKGDTGNSQNLVNATGEVKLVHDISKTNVTIDSNGDSDNKSLHFNFKVAYDRGGVYSVRFTGSNPHGVREDDAVGMVANVAVDDEIVQNDFDNVPFFNRPICNAKWDAVARKWKVTAYKGEPDFSWNGGDAIGEVMYECTPFYYKADFKGEGAPNYISVCGYPRPGYVLAPLFKNGHDKVYCACFYMGIVNSKPVSRAGQIPATLSLNNFMINAKLFDTAAQIETIEQYFSDCLLLWVEFATKQWRSKLPGCSGLSYASNETRLTSIISTTQFVVSYDTGSKFYPLQYIGIGSTQNGDQRTAYVQILSITPNVEQTYSTIVLASTVSGLAIGDYISTRGYLNGFAATRVTSASSGCAVNLSGRYPCIWRGKENPYGNLSSVIGNILQTRSGAGTVEDPYVYKICYLSDPTKYSSGTVTSDYFTTPVNYLGGQSGYIKTLNVNTAFPFIFIINDITGTNNMYITSKFDTKPAWDTASIYKTGGNFNSIDVGLTIQTTTALTASTHGQGARLFINE